jgi:hypothetical protein
VTALAPAIAIDGQIADWADVAEFPVAGGSLALAGNAADLTNLGESGDLLVRATYLGGPLDSVTLDLSPSPARPASGGTDRIALDAAGTHYEKNGVAITPAEPALALAWTADGFEASVAWRWLTYQGALRMQLVGVRGGEEIVRADAIDVCFGFRTGSYALPSSACVVTR